MDVDEDGRMGDKQTPTTHYAQTQTQDELRDKTQYAQTKQLELKDVASWCGVVRLIHTRRLHF